MANTPKGMAATIIEMEIVFLIISNLKTRSERPFTYKILRLSAQRWSNIQAKQNTCKKIAELAHLSVSNVKIKGLANAAKRHMPKKMTMEVMLMYLPMVK